MKERKYEIGYMIGGKLVTEVVYTTMFLMQVQQLWIKKVGSSNFRYIREK